MMISIAGLQKGDPMQTIDKTKVDKIIDRLLENNDLTASPEVWYRLHQIKNLPVTEIITCGECKHKNTHNCMLSLWATVFNSEPKDDFFCGMAERRTDGQQRSR